MTNANPAPRGRVRLHFLDGLRGLAALYVVLYHEVLINKEAQIEGDLSAPLKVLREILNHGHFSVVFFIVLSGFSLMLPLATSPTGELAGGLREFARRRARRIFPPYYAALAFSLGTIAAYKFGAPLIHLKVDPSNDVFAPGPILSHLFLVHNFVFEWAYLINAPMWSIPTEWHIYFLFALILLPIWRRAGIAVTVVVAFVLGCAPYVLLPADKNFYWACPWFLGSFALGMASALIGFSPKLKDSAWARAPWRALSLATLALIAIISLTDVLATMPNPVMTTDLLVVIPYPLMDTIVSLFAFFVVNDCAVLALKSYERPSLFLKVLESKPIVALGGFSYSLYLVQHPFLKLVGKVLNKVGVSRDVNLLIQLFAFTAILIVIAQLFSKYFEKPFQTQPKKA